MGKFEGILIATDLDGTLYKNDKTISKENKDAIDYFKGEGGFFTFITGRLPEYSMAAYRAVNPNIPFGCANGGGVYDGERQKYVWACDGIVGSDDLVQLVDERFPSVGIITSTFEKTYFSKDNDATAIFRTEAGLPHLSRHYREVDEPIAKIIFGSCCEDDILGVEKMLKEHPKVSDFDFIRSEKKLFEILPKGTNKGLALSKLIEYLGIDRRKTVAVGDYNNDIGMFENAGVAIAVSNATSEAKEAADYITVSNEEHAIAQVIRDIQNGKFGF